jgi:hypothetical protein
VITNSEKTEIEADGLSVSVIPAWEWLLEDEKKEEQPRR